MKEEYNEVVFDIESNGLLHEVDRVWVIAAISLDGRKQWIFSDYYTGDYEKSGSLEDGVKFLLSKDRVICHNMAGYDYILMEKFWPELWNRKTMPFKKVWDTFVQSKCQHFDRHALKGVKTNHGLEYWGVKFGYPKPPIEDWSFWDADKLNRCLVDIEINRRTYHFLNKEAADMELNFVEQIRRTQMTQYWYAHQELFGVYGNVELMKKYKDELDERINELAAEIEPNLPPIIKAKAPKCTWEDIRDKWPRFFRKVPKTKYDEAGKPIKDTYMPTLKVFVKNGDYDRHTAKWFDIDPKESKESGKDIIGGPYTKIVITPSRMSQHAVVKDYLLSIGWQPTQWNFEKNQDGSIAKDSKNKPIKKSPKLTEDSFDSIEGEVGEKIAEYNTLVHRRRTIANEKDDKKGWINQIREDGRISAGCMAWQTGTGRGAQKGIVNVPSPSATFGSPMREVWEASEGNLMISVDMDSAQMRLLANFMGDEDYTKAVLEGEEFDADHNYVGTDAHTVNAKAFGTLRDDLWEEARETQDKDLIAQCSSIRKTGKNGFYALLFGAGDEKLANTLKVSGGAKQGKMIKERFKRKLSGAGDLTERLKEQWLDNPWHKGGFIEVAGNTWVWCPSEHKLLNYLLMGSEAVLQNQAICWVNPQIEKRGLHGNQLLSIHDELTFEFPVEEESDGINLLSEMYGNASKAIGLEVLVTGTAMSGKNWLEIH